MTQLLTDQHEPQTPPWWPVDAPGPSPAPRRPPPEQSAAQTPAVSGPPAPPPTPPWRPVEETPWVVPPPKPPRWERPAAVPPPLPAPPWVWRPVEETRPVVPPYPPRWDPPVVGRAIVLPLGPDSGEPVPAGSAADAGGRAADRIPPVPLLPAGWRRLARVTTAGLFKPGSADALQREQQLVARIRSRVRDPRTVVFLAGRGGVGTTTAAVAAALALASVRNDRTVLLDARCDTLSLGQWLADRQAPTIVDLAHVPGAPAPGLPLEARNCLGIVDGVRGYPPPSADELTQVVGDLRERYPFLMVDVGNDTGELARAMVGLADQVVIVTGPGPGAARSTQLALGRIHHVSPELVATAAVVVGCATKGGARSRPTVHRLCDGLGIEPRQIVVLPYDPAFRTGLPVELASLRTATREACLQLVGRIAAG